jgi:hypothetical protein
VAAVAVVGLAAEVAEQVVFIMMHLQYFLQEH